MQELITRTTCDNCHGDPEKVKAEPLPPVTIGRGKPRVIDCCPECRATIYDPLVSLLESDGRTVDGRPPRRGRSIAAAADGGPVRKTSENSMYDCPDCDRSFETPQGRGAHRAQQHGYRREEAE